MLELAKTTRPCKTFLSVIKSLTQDLGHQDNPSTAPPHNAAGNQDTFLPLSSSFSISWRGKPSPAYPMDEDSVALTSKTFADIHLLFYN